MEVQVEKYIAGCLQNTPHSQEMLYKYCFDRFFKVCMRYHVNQADAISSFNKAMHKVFDNLTKYRCEGPFSAWARKVIINTCLNELRGLTRRGTVPITQTQESSCNAVPDVYGSISEKEILKVVQDLPYKCRVVFNMYVMDGYTHLQIAKVLGIPEGTSKWYLGRARLILKSWLLESGNAEYNRYAK